MKKFLKYILAICLIIPCAFMLVACGPDEGEEEPHNLEIKVALVDANGTVVDDDTDFQNYLIQSGNINGFVGAGSYAEQDHVGLQAPSLIKYRFYGWFNDSGVRVDGRDGNRDFWWNMEYDRDGYVEARYKVLEYNVQMFVGHDGGTRYEVHYNALTDTITPTSTTPVLPEFMTVSREMGALPRPSNEEHYNFVKWMYPDESTFPATLQVCTAFPILEDDVSSDRGLSLISEYKKAVYSFSISKENDDLKFIDGDTFEEVTFKNEYEYETEIDLWVDTANLDTAYEFEGIYINGVKIPDIDLGRPCNRTTITITADTVVEVKVKLAD